MNPPAHIPKSVVAKYAGHRRSEYTLASKCVLDVYDGKPGLDGHPDAIPGAVERALARLATDHIDLYYLHRLNKNVPVEDFVGALLGTRSIAHLEENLSAAGISLTDETIKQIEELSPGMQ